MGYEIPSQLEYQEKIMFNLNFKQLLYAFVTIIVDFTLFFKTPIDNLYVKASFLVIPTILGAGFMFFDLDKYLLNMYYWLRSQRIKDVKSLIGKRKEVAVLEVRPINFNIKTREEKNSICHQFLKFMNAIDFPIQFLMKTKEIDIDSYLDKLETPKEYAVLFEKNKEFMKNLILENKVKDRVFYLVIPKKDHLDIQVSICLDWLKSLNLKVFELSKKEVDNFFKIEGELKNKPSHLQIGKEFHRIVYAHGYPRIVEQGFLDKIVSSIGNFDFSLHINPHDVELMMVNINRELQKQKSDLYSMGLKGVINPALEIQYSDTRRVLEELQKGNDKLFNISLYIDCKADDLKELDLVTRKVQAMLNSLMILPKSATFQMDRGFRSILPLGENHLKVERNVTSKALSAFFPFTSPFFESDDKGVWLGVNKNGIPIIKDIFELSNPNGIILAQSGGGKSFFAKLLISRYLLNGTRVMVIDPQGEYRNLIKQFNGQRVDLSRTSDTIINPLDLMGHDYSDKRLSLMDLMKVMLGDLSEPQKGFIDKAISQVYANHGINLNPSTWKNKAPILQELVKVLEDMEKDALQLEKTSIRSLMNRLSIYSSGVFSFLNRQTKIDLKNQFICFDIGDIPKPVKPVIMFLVLDYIYAKMKKDLDRKILLIDEAWSLLSRAEDASYIFEIVKTCRKFNMGLLLINQEVEGLLTSDAGKSVLANSAYTFLMKQKPAVINSIQKVFNLSKYEKDYLLSASIGEGLLIIENDHYEMKVIASDEEHKVITTKADELLEQKEEVIEVIEAKDINVDFEKKYQYAKNLNQDEIEYLLSNGFKEFKRKGLLSNEQEMFILKPNHNESLKHHFYVYNIAEYLEKQGVKVEKYVTVKPDLVFKIGKKKIAIEVETGIVAQKNNEKLKSKVNQLNKNYDYWFFVILDRNKIKTYKKCGKTVELRCLKLNLDKCLKFDKPKSKKNKDLIVGKKENNPKI
jgi:conjugal transfer ATP-binding protein TraC